LFRNLKYFCIDFLDFWPMKTVLGFLPLPARIIISPVMGFISSRLIFRNSLALAPLSNKVINIALSLVPVKVLLEQDSLKALIVYKGTGPGVLFTRQLSARSIRMQVRTLQLDIMTIRFTIVEKGQ
jgi:hypothetical protein